MLLRLFSLAALLSVLSGCAYNASPYGASVQNVEAIKAYRIKPVSVARFTARNPGDRSIVCRASGPVTVSPSFEGYIERAFIDELKLAGAYDPASPLTITGRLDDVDFSSGMLDGNWSFTLTLSNARNESYTTRSTLRFSGNFIADRACQEVAQAFGPAVQQLVGDVVRDPKFRQIAN